MFVLWLRSKVAQHRLEWSQLERLAIAETARPSVNAATLLYGSPVARVVVLYASVVLLAVKCRGRSDIPQANRQYERRL